jgi:hypothetical protein
VALVQPKQEDILALPKAPEAKPESPREQVPALVADPVQIIDTSQKKDNLLIKEDDN